MDPERISAAVGISPFRYWKVGEPRVSPKGLSLPGENRESFWAAALHEERNLSSEQIALEDFLFAACTRFAHLKEFFREVTETGGYVEFFVGWFGPSMFGASFEPKLMREAAELNIAIGLDVYVGGEEAT